MLQFVSHFIRKLTQYTSNVNEHIIDSNYIVECKMKDPGGPIGWIDIFVNENKRIEYIDSGVESAKLFLQNLQEQKDKNEKTAVEDFKNYLQTTNIIL